MSQACSHECIGFHWLFVCEKAVGFATTCLKSYWTIDAFKVTLVRMPKVCKLATVFAFVAQSESSLLKVTCVLVELLVCQTDTCSQHHLLTSITFAYHTRR